MAGYTQVNCEEVRDDIERLILKAKERNIPLGAVQSMTGRTWRIAV
jgi:hypothetical protein